MFLIIFAGLMSVALGQIPIWYPNGECGISKYADAGDYELPSKMVVGGTEARENEFPWQVSLRRMTTKSHFCGGSIINENWILTAAHCVNGEAPGDLFVVVGDYTRSDLTNPNRQSHNVSLVIVHENYGPVRIVNDIALLKLVNSISMTENVTAVCAPDPASLYVHYKSQVSGWGTTVSGGTCCPDTLLYTTLNTTTNQYCDAVYTSSTISDDMICATDNFGSNDRDSCQGDSGGPLTIKEVDGTFRLIGSVSWGIGCASGYPGVYCRIPYFTSWVTNKINNN